MNTAEFHFERFGQPKFEVPKHYELVAYREEVPLVKKFSQWSNQLLQDLRNLKTKSRVETGKDSSNQIADLDVGYAHMLINGFGGDYQRALAHISLSKVTGQGTDFQTQERVEGNIRRIMNAHFIYNATNLSESDLQTKETDNKGKIINTEDLAQRTSSVQKYLQYSLEEPVDVGEYAREFPEEKKSKLFPSDHQAMALAALLPSREYKSTTPLTTEEQYAIQIVYNQLKGATDERQAEKIIAQALIDLEKAEVKHVRGKLLKNYLDSLASKPAVPVIAVPVDSAISHGKQLLSEARIKKFIKEHPNAARTAGLIATAGAVLTTAFVMNSCQPESNRSVDVINGKKSNNTPLVIPGKVPSFSFRGILPDGLGGSLNGFVSPVSPIATPISPLATPALQKTETIAQPASPLVIVESVIQTSELTTLQSRVNELEQRINGLDSSIKATYELLNENGRKINSIDNQLEGIREQVKRIDRNMTLPKIPLSPPLIPERNYSPIQKRYTVKYGDNLWNIAMTFYGDPYKWKMLYEKNKEVIGANARLIRPGQILVLP